MAKRKTNNDAEQEEVKVCGDCIHGEWIDESWNRDVKESKPICVRCKYCDFARLRSEKGCINFLHKLKK